MHSTQGPSGMWYAHNGDWSGTVRASIPVKPSARYGEDDYACASDAHEVVGEEGKFVEVEIPFEDIRALYLTHARSEAISRLEQAEDDELEALLFGGPQKSTQPSLEFAPGTPLPQWVDEAQLIRKRWTRHILRRATDYEWVHKSNIYVHTERPWVLAHVDDLPVDGSVRFAVWDASQGRGWQSGAGAQSQDEFKSLYPLRYTGDNPEVINPA